MPSLRQHSERGPQDENFPPQDSIDVQDSPE